MSAIVENCILKKGEFEFVNSSETVKIYIHNGVKKIEKDAFPLRSFVSEYHLTYSQEIWISIVVSVNRFGRNWNFDVWFSDNRSLEMIYAEYEAEEYEDEEYEDEEAGAYTQNTIDDVIEEYIQVGVVNVFDYINDVIGFFDENCKELFSLKKKKVKVKIVTLNLTEIL